MALVDCGDLTYGKVVETHRQVGPRTGVNKTCNGHNLNRVLGYRDAGKKSREE